MKRRLETLRRTEYVTRRTFVLCLFQYQNNCARLQKAKESGYHQMVEDFAKNLHSKQNTHLSQLIRNCLKVDPAERMNSKSALAHRFITGPVSPDLDGLMPNQRLNKGASLFSKNRIRELAYQDDGNLVLYDRSGGTRKPLWVKRLLHVDIMFNVKTPLLSNRHQILGKNPVTSWRCKVSVSRILPAIP